MPFWMGDDERASELFGQALETGRRLGDAPLTSQALGGLARVALRTDVAEGSAARPRGARGERRRRRRAGRSNALHLLGVGAQIAGDLLEAREWMTQRLALVRATGNEFLIASEAGNLEHGRAPARRPRRRRGARSRGARDRAQRTGDQFTTPFAISGLASIATERGDFERAATLVGAAEAIMEAQQMAWPPDERPHYERLLATCRRRWARTNSSAPAPRGREMPPSEAIEFALGESSTVSVRPDLDTREPPVGIQ